MNGLKSEVAIEDIERNRSKKAITNPKIKPDFE